MSLATNVKRSKPENQAPNVVTKTTEHKYEEDRIRDSRKIKGMFQCHEPRGGSVDFHFKKYKGDPVQRYNLIDGKIYELPVAVVNHINQNCNYPVYKENLDPQGDRLVEVGKKVQRFNFVVIPE